MKIQSTKETKGTSIVMIVYGHGGVGKTTFAATFPKPLLLDFEDGSKFLGDRGIHIDVAVCPEWLSHEDKKELTKQISNYDTVIIDTISEAMEKLIKSRHIPQRHKQRSGDLTMTGWGYVKDEMKSFIKWLRASGKHVVFITHISEIKDEERLCFRPKLITKLQEDMLNMVDLIGYMYKTKNGKREIYFGGSDEKIICKDRTGKLPSYIMPTFGDIEKYINIRPQAGKPDQSKPDHQDDVQGAEEILSRGRREESRPRQEPPPVHESPPRQEVQPPPRQGPAPSHEEAIPFPGRRARVVQPAEEYINPLAKVQR